MINLNQKEETSLGSCSKCDDLESVECYDCYTPYLDKYNCKKCENYYEFYPENDGSNWGCDADIDPMDLYENQKAKKCPAFTSK